ncbi:MAG: hypothetical protein ACTS78_03115 [Arsenophonus sp. NC-WZS1-MAG3]
MNLIYSEIFIFIVALDDRFDISVKVQETVQAIVVVVMIYFADLTLDNLGYVLG